MEETKFDKFLSYLHYLFEKYETGIHIYDLPNVFQKEFRKSFECRMHGFRSTEKMLLSIKPILHLQRNQKGFFRLDPKYRIKKEALPPVKPIQHHNETQQAFQCKRPILKTIYKAVPFELSKSDTKPLEKESFYKAVRVLISKSEGKPPEKSIQLSNSNTQQAFQCETPILEPFHQAVPVTMLESETKPSEEPIRPSNKEVQQVFQCKRPILKASRKAVPIDEANTSEKCIKSIESQQTLQAPSPSPTEPSLRIYNEYIITKPGFKFSFLVHFLKNTPKKHFISVKSDSAVRYYGRLLRHFIKSCPIYLYEEEVSEEQFNSMLTSFPEGIFVCHSSLAKHLDMFSIDWFIQFDVEGLDKKIFQIKNLNLRPNISILIILGPGEKNYLYYLEKVSHFKEMSYTLDVTDLRADIYKMTLEDKQLFNLGMEVFLSSLAKILEPDLDRKQFMLKEPDFEQSAIDLGLLQDY